MRDFTVTRDNESWSLSWAHGVMFIAPAEWPYGIALDAALEFMDRFSENNVPRFCETPGDLMRFCASEARKQR